MPPVEVNQAGTYRGRITEYSFYAAKSGAVAINITARVHEIWGEDEGDWLRYPDDAEVIARGAIWIIKKDSTLHAAQVEALCQHCAWDGSLDSIGAQTWRPSACSFVVEEDDYNNASRFRVAWINAWNAAPGGKTQSNIDAEGIKALALKHSSALKAIAANAKRNAAPAPASTDAFSSPAAAQQALDAEAPKPAPADLPF